MVSPKGYGRLLVLSLLALLVGVASGLIGAVFRLTLEAADRFRGAAIAWAHGGKFVGFFLIVGGCAAAVALAAWLVRRFSPYASGSGIPQVEAVLRDELPPPPPRLLLVKFLGGLLAIGSGLALGREGPSVQMGAAIAHVVGRLFRRDWLDCKVLIAAGAGAGLATAFNAPIAGAVFAFEELVRRFEARTAIAVLGASAAAIAVARLFLGPDPDFAVVPLTYVGARTWPLFAALGAAAGLVAVAYNAALLYALRATDRLGRWPVEIRGAAIGASVGVLGWFLPDLVGGGDDVTQRVLAGGTTIAIVPLAFLLRFALGAVSYAAATPGGLFSSPGPGGAARSSRRRPLRRRLPRYGSRTQSLRRRRNGSFLYRRGPGPGDRHHPRYRDDRQLPAALADDQRLLCGDARPQPAGCGPDLRLAGRAHPPAAEARKLRERTARRHSLTYGRARRSLLTKRLVEALQRFRPRA